MSRANPPWDIAASYNAQCTMLFNRFRSLFIVRLIWQGERKSINDADWVRFRSKARKIDFLDYQPEIR
jgi:hypothetical protein